MSDSCKKKKYLVRAGFNPIKDNAIDYSRCIWKPYVGGNSGNLMFAYGVMNVLLTEQTEIETTAKFFFSDEEIERINEEYDAFILPMADAFRKDFIEKLKLLTDSIDKMRIPVIVIGVGVRADYEPDFDSGMEFDKEVTKFVKAVLRKSSKLGLRGELTAEYLRHLGFRPEIDYTPIGCPSLYTYGDSIHTRKKSDYKKLVVNTNGFYDIGNVNAFLINTVSMFPDYYLVQQVQRELQDMYIGKWWIPYAVGRVTDYQKDMIIEGEALKELYMEDRVRFFFDVVSWINFMKQFDLFVGNRFHGTVAAILSGIPHVAMPFNARTRELVEYHKITHLSPYDVSKEQSIKDYIHMLDFNSFEKHQKANLEHYVDFLDSSELIHIFNKKREYSIGESLLEREISERLGDDLESIENVVHPILSLKSSERVKRIIECNLKAFPLLFEKIKKVY